MSPRWLFLLALPLRHGSAQRFMPLPSTLLRRGGSAAAAYAANATSSALSYAASSLTYLGLGFGEACPFHPEPLPRLRTALQHAIIGQDAAHAAIENAVADWRGAAPLILAIVGPTGTGKTETAHRTAAALLGKAPAPRLPRRDRAIGDTPSVPGLLELRGEHFSSAHPETLEQNRLHLRRRLYQHFQACDGVGVVLVDELQKFQVGLLDEFLEPMDAARPRVGLEKSLGSGYDQVPLRRVVFILVTDVASESLARMLATYQAGPDGAILGRLVPQAMLERACRHSLAAHFAHQRIDRLIQHYVGFLPLGVDEVTGVLDLRMAELDLQHWRADHWKGLVWERGVTQMLSRNAFVAYDRVEGDGDAGFIFTSAYGARVNVLETMVRVLRKQARPWRRESILFVGTNATLDEPQRLRQAFSGTAGQRLQEMTLGTAISLWWCSAEAMAGAPRQTCDIEDSPGGGPAGACARASAQDGSADEERVWEKSADAIYHRLGRHGCPAELGLDLGLGPETGCLADLAAAGTGACEWIWTGSFLEEFLVGLSDAV